MTKTMTTNEIGHLPPHLIIKRLVEDGGGLETVEEIRRQFVELVGMRPHSERIFASNVEHYRERAAERKGERR